jgi:hypothetical protein
LQLLNIQYPKSFHPTRLLRMAIFRLTLLDSLIVLYNARTMFKTLNFANNNNDDNNDPRIVGRSLAG